MIRPMGTREDHHMQTSVWLVVGQTVWTVIV